MDKNYDNALRDVLVQEGGVSNNPHDPGGFTAAGVTAAAGASYRRRHNLPPKPVNKWSSDEVRQFYYDDYWVKCGGPDLFPGVDLFTFDSSVNSGVSRGRKWLVASLDKKNRHDQTVHNMAKKRLSFLEGLKIWKYFGKGWLRRVTTMEATGVKWALAAMGNNAVQVRRKLQEKQASAEIKSKSSVGVAVGSGGVGTATSTGTGPAHAAWNGVDSHTLAVVAVIAFVVTAFFVWKAVVNHSRQKALNSVINGDK